MTMAEEGQGSLDSSYDGGLSVSEELVPSAPQRTSEVVTLDFGGLLNPPLRLQTNETQCGGQLWPGGMVLAEYLLKKTIDDLAGKMMFVVRAEVYFCVFGPGIEAGGSC